MVTMFSVVIPNWNGQHLLEKNIPFVVRAAQECTQKTALPHEIIVVDDGSSDTSVDFLRTRHPHITVITLGHNHGFHRATNRGVMESRGSVVILLNTDVEPHPHSLSPLMIHFADADVFAASGRIYSGDKKTFLYGNRGGYFKQGHFFLTEKSEFDRSQTLFACGGAGAFSREKFLALGGFDTLFAPFYYEEQDISYRALKRGWRIIYEPASIMYHQVRGSIGTRMTERAIGYISARNNYLFAIKNITDVRYTVHMLVFIPLFLLRDLFRLKWRFWIAASMAFPRIPRAIAHRIKERRFRVHSDAYILSLVQPPSPHEIHP